MAILSTWVEMTERALETEISRESLLSFVECSKNSIGTWNEKLSQFGLRSRLKVGDSSPDSYEEVGTHIYISLDNSINKRGNRYLNSQYRRLKFYRKNLLISSYWKLSWSLMLESWTSIAVAKLTFPLLHPLSW